MRVLHCIPNMLSGGAQRQLSYLAAAQATRGWEVHVALLRGGPMLSLLQSSGALIHQLRGLGSYDPQLLWQLVGLLRSTRPDVLQTWLVQMDVLGGMAAMLSGVPWVLSERTSRENYSRPQNCASSVKHFARRLLGSAADAVVANSEGGKAYWADSRACRGVCVIGNIVPLVDIDQATPGGEQFDIAPGRRMVLYVGRFSPEKNLENLIRGIARVIPLVPVTAVLCGDGTHQRQVQAFIREQGLSGQILVSGYSSNVWSLMKRADVFVTVSSFEGQPNTVLEAAACECPLVVSDIPAHRELLTAETATFVNAHHPEDIARGIRVCLADRNAAAQRAQAARRTVEAKSAKEIARQYEEVYLRIRSAPAPLGHAA